MDPRAPAKIKRKSSCPFLRIRGPVSLYLNLTRGLSTSVDKGYFGPPRVGRLAAHRLLEFPAKAGGHFGPVEGGPVKQGRSSMLTPLSASVSAGKRAER